MARMPDAADEIRFAPVRMLRTVFSGVGQLLLAADRFRAEEASQVQVAPAERRDAPGPLDPAVPDQDPELAESGLLKITGNGDYDLAHARAPGRAGGAGKAAAGKGAKAGKAERSGKSKPAATGSVSARAGSAGVSSPARSGSASKQAKPSATGTARTGQSGTGGKANKPAKTDKAPRDANSGQAAGARPARKPSGKRQSPPPARFRSLDSTGNVRILSEQDVADLAEDERHRRQAAWPFDQLGQSSSPVAYEPAIWSPGTASFPLRPSQESAPLSPATSPVEPALVPAEPGYPYTEPGYAAEPGPVAGEETEPALAEPWPPAEPADLPVADYDALSLASLRARLRGLDVAQLQVLADYERAHGSRADIVTMFENRIAKLQS
jgi:hypothetical protein